MSGSRRLSSPVEQAGAALERALFEVKKVVVGQDRMVERMLVALLARGHCLLEGVPGVAKSLAVETLATVVGGSSVRLQFTPDLVPSETVRPDWVTTVAPAFPRAVSRTRSVGLPMAVDLVVPG